MNSTRLCLGCCVLALVTGLAPQAEAALAISSAATKNVNCVSGVCTATAKNAVLNAGSLQTMLGSGSVTVATGSKAVDIAVYASFSWTSASTLTLDSYHSITINQPVSSTGTGGLTIKTNDGGSGGTFSFGPKGNVSLWSLSDALTINGNVYTLVGNIATLASDIAANPSGYYALAQSYNAGVDRTYSSDPVPTTFSGTFEGLGNTISNLSMSGNNVTGMFAEVTGTIENLNLLKLSFQASNNLGNGGLARYLINGTLRGISLSGTVASSGYAGGLVGGSSYSVIANSHSSATVSGNGSVGGLVGGGSGTISNSYATGKVRGGRSAVVGGLVGLNSANVETCYATGAVYGGNSAYELLPV